jgi:hypothetical protein
LAATEPGRPSGDETLTPDSSDLTDRSAPRPRVSTRALVVAALVLAVLVLVSLVVGFVLLHQPRLTPVPVPSVPSIA